LYPNEFNYISSEIRKVSAANSKLLLLGRPGSIETEEEERRLTRLKIGCSGKVAEVQQDRNSRTVVL
jgi:hypothetical protein